MVRDDAGIAAADDRHTALVRVAERAEQLFANERERRSIVPRLAVMLGLETPAAAMPDVDPDRVSSELAWAIRRYADGLARRGPTVVVVDDLQWAEAPLIAAVEQIADRVKEAPLFLLCIARPDLLETRAGWGSGKSNSTLITLDPLSASETRTLIARLLDIEELPERLRSEIVARAEGNPLFCEEFLRTLIDEGKVIRDGGRWRATAAAVQVRVPESIQAVLGARLDALDPAERHALQTASVIGERFDSRQVAALDRTVATATFDGLIDKGLVLEDADGGEGTSLRFKHLLIREAAYSSMSKALRGDLHERFGLELERAVGDRRDEFAEILAHHAERALSIAVELRAGSGVVRPRAERALDMAVQMAERAISRGDAGAAERFVDTAERGVATLSLPDTDARAALVQVLRARQLVDAGAYDAVVPAAERAVRAALSSGRPDLAGRAETIQLTRIAWAGSDEELIGYEALAEQAISHFQTVGDEASILGVELLLLETLWGTGRLTDMLARGDALLSRALALGDRANASAIAARLAGAALWFGRGTDAERYLRGSQEHADAAGIQPRWLRQVRGRSAALHGQDAEAERIFRENIAYADETGNVQLGIGALRGLAEVLLDGGLYDDARQVLTRALAESERSGERWNRTEIVAMLAIIEGKRRNVDDAERLVQEAQATLRVGDPAASAVVHAALAAVRGAQGRDAEAEAALRSAIQESGQTEYHVATAIHRIELAEFLAAGGRPEEAARELTDAEGVFATAGLGPRGAQRERIRSLLARAAAR
jgi:tetratricopeptide (TPR) repeat protein